MLMHPAALELVLPHVDDAALRADAIEASLKIARAIGGAHKEAAKTAAARIEAATHDTEYLRQAKNIQRDIPVFEDFIMAWEVAGPYTQAPKDGPQLFEVAFAPEHGKSAPVEWKIMPTDGNGDRPWRMDLRAFLDGEHRVAYLRSLLIVPRAQDVSLEMGSNDGLKAWLNGASVFGNNATRGCSPGSDSVNVHLNQGENVLMLKIINGGGWAACAQVKALDGGAVEGLLATFN